MQFSRMADQRFAGFDLRRRGGRGCGGWARKRQCTRGFLGSFACEKFLGRATEQLTIDLLVIDDCGRNRHATRSDRRTKGGAEGAESTSRGTAGVGAIAP